MFYVTVNGGVKIAVYDYNPSGTETIFLVHGWPLSHKIFEYQLELLTAKDYRVVAVDLRGFGMSDTPSSGYCYDRMAADLHQVIKFMRLRNFILAGFSMGGAIVLRYMRLYREFGVKKLILLAAAAPCWTMRPGYPYGLTPEYVNQLIRLASTDRPQLCENFSRQLFASPQTEAAVHWFRDIALSASGIGTVQSAVSLRDEDGRDDLEAVHVPTFLIHGAKDVVVDNNLVRLQHQGIPGSILYNLKNSGHGIMYDELQLFNQYFLKAVEE